MTAGHVDRGAMVALFGGVRDAFPHLRMEFDLEHPQVDLMLTAPRQDGLAFTVSLNLQGDELHLSAGAFWVSWFPCTDAYVADRYRDAATGLLSGRYRILEHCLGNHVVKAELQHPDGERWRTIATWSNLSAWLPWRRSRRVLQNRTP